MGGRGATSTVARQDTSYWLEHRPGNPLLYPDEVATIDRIESSGIFPRDFLTHPEYYLIMDSERGARETLNKLKEVQDNPDAVVTVYRGSPVGELNQGDWVTLSRTYAEIYAGDGAYSDNANSKVFSYRVKASELSFDGDDISEFGYWGDRKVARGQ